MDISTPGDSCIRAMLRSATVQIFVGRRRTTAHQQGARSQHVAAAQNTG